MRHCLFYVVLVAHNRQPSQLQPCLALVCMLWMEADPCSLLHHRISGVPPCGVSRPRGPVGLSTPSPVPVPGVREEEFEMDVALVTVFRGETP